MTEVECTLHRNYKLQFVYSECYSIHGMESHSVSESLQKNTYIKGWVLREHTDQHKNSGSLRHITHTQQQ